MVGLAIWCKLLSGPPWKTMYWLRTTLKGDENVSITNGVRDLLAPIRLRLDIDEPIDTGDFDRVAVGSDDDIPF
jgi:hypothetical protein